MCCENIRIHSKSSPVWLRSFRQSIGAAESGACQASAFRDAAIGMLPDASWVRESTQLRLILL